MRHCRRDNVRRGARRLISLLSKVELSLALEDTPVAMADGKLIHIRVSEDDDATLVGRARSGEEAAFERLVERHMVHVVRVLNRILGADSDIPDLANEVLHLAFERLEHIEDHSSFITFISGVSVNVARNRLRSKRRKKWLVFGVEFNDPPTADGTDAREALLATYAVLATLDEDLRICFALRYIDGRELTEVAELTGVSLATTKRWLRRAEVAFLDAARAHPVLETWVKSGTRWGAPS